MAATTGALLDQPLDGEMAGMDAQISAPGMSAGRSAQFSTGWLILTMNL
jgi:hypothetical protein